MLGNCWPAHRKTAGKLSNRLFTASQRRKDCPSRRIGQSAKSVNILHLSRNHIVTYWLLKKAQLFCASGNRMVTDYPHISDMSIFSLLCELLFPFFMRFSIGSL